MKAKIKRGVVGKALEARRGSPRIGFCRKYQKTVYSEHKGCPYFEFRKLQIRGVIK